jgi:hypothetical protein
MNGLERTPPRSGILASATILRGKLPRKKNMRDKPATDFKGRKRQAGILIVALRFAHPQGLAL